MLNLESIAALIKISNGQTASEDTPIKARHLLYKAGLIEHEIKRTYVGPTEVRKVRKITEKGRVFLEMLTKTPLPVEVSQPRFVDPREQK